MLLLLPLVLAAPLAQGEAGNASLPPAQGDAGIASFLPAQSGRNRPAHSDIEVVARYQCLSCHQAEPTVDQQIWSHQAPALHDIGDRVAPAWLMGRLTEPNLASGHGRMPDVMGERSFQDRAEIATDLIHYLYQQRTFVLEPLEVNSKMAERGQQLFESVGCLPCHQDRLQGRGMERKYSIASLRDLLLDPLKARPSGVMPNSKLTPAEATDIATWVLRKQFEKAKVRQVPGLRYSYYEHGDWPSSGTFDWSQIEPVEVGVATTVHHRYGTRRENYGLVFEGYVEIREAGEYRFSTRSDDGSHLWVGGKQLVENGGFHGPINKESEPIQLPVGRHPIRISFFEKGGGEELSVKWTGPGFDWRALEAEALWHRGIAPAPMMYQAWEVDVAAADRGRRHFEQLNCANCHDDMGVQPTRFATAWEKVDAARPGCLNQSPESRGKLLAQKSIAPRFTFADGEHDAVLRVLAGRSSMTKLPSPTQIMHRGLERFQCLQCHTATDLRDPRQPAGHLAGPSAELQAYFTSTDDLGDEGRFPPDLSDAGEKFRLEWLRQGLVEGIGIRPAMNTRMPAFGHGSKPLAVALAAAAKNPSAAQPSDPQTAKTGEDFDPAIAKAGQELVGVGGLSCIICHGAGGYPSIGVQGPDLSDMHERLQPQWFRKWMEAPPTMRPGTRMPMFWFNGKSAATHVLDGEMDGQIDALWEYLSLGHAAPLPKGLVVDQSEYDLVPQDHPIYFGPFMKGLSARVLTVGFPQRVSLAFDQHNVRTGQIWQGDFINAKGTWQGRAGQLERPAGGKVVDLPAGPAIAVLTNPMEPWPVQGGKYDGWRYKGHSRSAEGIPTFRYQYKDLMVEETWQPHIAPGAISFDRSFRVTSPEQRTDVYLRVADRKVAADVLFRFPNQDDLPRFHGADREILIPLTFVAQGEQFVAQTTMRMTW